MAQNTNDTDTIDFSFSDVFESILDSYRYMEMPVNQYLTRVLAPGVVVGIGVIIAAVFLQLQTFVMAPVIVLGLLIPFVAIIYPKLHANQKAGQMRERFHLFLTHLTVLSATEIERMEIFRTLAKEDEYEALADEMGYLVGLVDTWNQSLGDACRMRAKKVPSELLEDFLERLAYTVGAGQEVSEFLMNEQDVFIQKFSIRYESDLSKIDVMKELFMSMVLSVTFTLVFAIVLPILTGVNPTMTVSGVIVMYAVIEAAFLYAIHSIAPHDPVWFFTDTDTDRDSRIKISIAVGFGLSILTALIVGGILLGLIPISREELPMPVWMALPTTPMLLPGLIMRREEERVKDRDDQFVSFIRALGAVETVKQTSTSNVLKTLRLKDFGALTKNIDNLYKRLHMRIDSGRAWELFAAETGSYLIQKFGQMYVFARGMGGDPRQIGELISKNMNEVLSLREKRSQETVTLIGVVYGMTAASIFSCFVGLTIVRLLMQIVSEMDIDQSLIQSILHTSVYDVPQIQFLLLITIVLNAVLCSIMIRITDRGHMVNSYMHFVALTWMGSLTAVVTKHVASSIISV